MITNISAFLITSIIIFFTALLWKKTRGVCRIKKDLTGQIVVITGANTGIGKETAHVLAQMKATVILACRDPKRTLPVVWEIKEKTGNPNVEFMRMDLADLQSIKTFADDFRKKYKSLHILINNAGVSILERQTTKDGFEAQFGTNHLGHFYLTNLLLDIIEKSAPSRVINLTSRGSLGCRKMEWDDLMYEKRTYRMLLVYAQSKLANIMFTKELQKRESAKGLKVVSVHPGLVRTEIFRFISEKWYMKVLYFMITPILYWFGKTPLEGAQTTLYCALEDHDKLQGGMYYEECKRDEENRLAYDEQNCRKLWDLSEGFISKALKK